MARHVHRLRIHPCRQRRRDGSRPVGFRRRCPGSRLFERLSHDVHRCPSTYLPPHNAHAPPHLETGAAPDLAWWRRSKKRERRQAATVRAGLPRTWAVCRASVCTALRWETVRPCLTCWEIHAALRPPTLWLLPPTPPLTRPR